MEVSWTVILPILISLAALLISWLSYRNSKSSKILSNQPMLEINHVFDESLQQAGYLTISLNNLNDKPIQVTKAEIIGENFNFEVDHGEFSIKQHNGEYSVPRNNSILIYIYMDKNQTLNKEMRLYYRDFENKERRLKSEKISLEEGKAIKKLRGSKFIMN